MSDKLQTETIILVQELSEKMDYLIGKINQIMVDQNDIKKRLDCLNTSTGASQIDECKVGFVHIPAIEDELPTNALPSYFGNITNFFKHMFTYSEQSKQELFDKEIITQKDIDTVVREQSVLINKKKTASDREKSIAHHLYKFINKNSGIRSKIQSLKKLEKDNYVRKNADPLSMDNLV